MIELIGLAFVVILIVSGVILFWLLFQEISRSPKKNKQSLKTHRKSSPSILPSPNSSIKKKLIKLLHGDETAADRLINSIQKQYPDKGYDWCLEKVIRDLERDRR